MLLLLLLFLCLFPFQNFSLHIFVVFTSKPLHNSGWGRLFALFSPFFFQKYHDYDSE